MTNLPFPIPPTSDSEESRIFKEFLRDLIVEATQCLERLEELPRKCYEDQLDLISLRPGRLSRASLLCVITEQYTAFTANRNSYKVSDYRKHCEPFLEKHLRQDDLVLDCDDRPKWHGRFDYAHKSVAEHFGYVVSGNGRYRLT